MRRLRPNSSEPIRPASTNADGLIALLYNPKRTEWIGAYGTGDGMAYLGLAYPESMAMPDEGLGLGFIDVEPIGECARIHAYPGVSTQGQGLGLCLYAGIAVLAASYLGQPCIGSAASGAGFGRRSAEADAMWRSLAQRRGGESIAYATDLCPSCVAADLEGFIRAGLVGWMRKPGPYEGLLLEAAERYLPSFAHADPKTRDPKVLGIIERVLLAGSDDLAAVRSWRQARQRGDQMVANGVFGSMADVRAHREQLGHLLGDTL